MSNIIINDILNSLTDAQRALDQLINDTDSIESIYKSGSVTD